MIRAKKTRTCPLQGWRYCYFTSALCFVGGWFASVQGAKRKKSGNTLLAAAICFYSGVNLKQKNRLDWSLRGPPATNDSVTLMLGLHHPVVALKKCFINKAIIEFVIDLLDEYRKHQAWNRLQTTYLLFVCFILAHKIAVCQLGMKSKLKCCRCHPRPRKGNYKHTFKATTKNLDSSRPSFIKTKVLSRNHRSEQGKDTDGRLVFWEGST